MDPDPLVALEQLAVASVAVTAQAIATVAPDLTFLQWRTLVVVGDGEPAAVGDVATRIGAHQSPTSRLLARMARRGLVSVGLAPGDRRVRLVALTDAGRAIRTAVFRQRRAALEQVAAAWRGDDDATRQLVALAENLAHSVGPGRAPLA